LSTGRGTSDRRTAKKEGQAALEVELEDVELEDDDVLDDVVLEEESLVDFAGELAVVLERLSVR